MPPRMPRSLQRSPQEQRMLHGLRRRSSCWIETAEEAMSTMQAAMLQEMSARRTSTKS